jgi:lipoic acid synthetase
MPRPGDPADARDGPLSARRAEPGRADLAPPPPRHPRPLGGDPLKLVDPPLLSLTGLILNNADGAVDSLAIRRKPPWLRAKVPGGAGYHRLRSIIDAHRLHTVCEEASCPNMGECWARGVATIMILGDTCTRACGFCNVKTGRPPTLDLDEPRRVADSLALMNLRHVVITSVNRDELHDGGAAVWAETIRRARDACPHMSIEVLVPDFEGNWSALQKVIDARPHIINHNLETVRRMYPAVRPSAKFDRSLELLRRVADQGMVAKTGIMVGIGEHDDEVLALMDEVRARTAPSAAGAARPGVEILTIGQYLQPTRNHLPIHRWVTPEQFAAFRAEGLARGFKVVESGPLVRSSYHADEQAGRLGAGEPSDSVRTFNDLLERSRQA